MKKFFTLVLLICLTMQGNLNSLEKKYDPEYILSNLSVPDLQVGQEYTGLIQQVLPSLQGEYFVVLNSGLTILIKEIDYSPVVSCRVTIKAGSIYEGDYLGAGVTHYLEHVVAGGTTTIRTEEENAAILKELGGATNASTSYDHTTYFIKTIPQNWDTAVQLLLSYITSCAFNENEILREKPVILQEMRMRENDPERQLWDMFISSAYRDNPIKFPIIGLEPAFRSLERDDLISYYKERYQPHNVVVSVVGKVNGIEVLKRIIDLSDGFVSTNYNEKPLLREEAQISQRRVEQVHPAAQLTSLRIGVPTVTLLDDNLFALDVLAIILGTGRTSRLYQSLKDEKQLVLSVKAFNWTPTFVNGTFMISADLDNQNVDSVIETIWDELEKIKQSGVTEEELNRAKRKVLAENIADTIQADSISAELSYNYMVTGDPHFHERYVVGIKKLTLDDIKQAARQYFNRDKQTVALLKPPALAVDTADYKQAETNGQSATELVVMPNGLKVLFKQSESYPMTHFALFLNGGLVYENKTNIGISSFLASMVTRGTTSRSKQDISRVIEDIGGSLSAASGKHTIYMTCSVLAGDAQTGFELFADVALNPSFPTDEIEKVREETLMMISKKKESWQSLIMDYFNQEFYKGHPYRFDQLGTEETVKSLTQNDLVAFYDMLFIPQNMVIAVYGNFDKKTITESITTLFGSIPDGRLVQPNAEIVTGTSMVQNVEIEKEGPFPSVTLLYGLPGITVTDKDNYVFDIIDAVISGIMYPSGWLHDGLRGQDKSLVYMVHAFSQFGTRGGHFAILSQTTPENYDQVTDIIEGVITRMVSDGITEEELRTAQSMCITMHELQRETPAAQAFSDGLNESIGLGFNYDNQYASGIESVTIEDVKRVAETHFAHFMRLAVVPEKKTALEQKIGE
ncbi:MAG: insulinase family protein [Candidatus Auribacter fodinae]|uniref:Insulinase family protein n=1 Tax=Candidatus Auribacter fodinae TaxID=2093366 RepID=A0A3A4R8K9_9BACT|nr:MAG: insulinase family protein [Candidatus Auribacter fodinae]